MASKSCSFYPRYILASAALVLALGCFDARPSAAVEGLKQFAVEVCEKGNRFVPDADPVIEGGDLDGFPAYGNEFITEGWIYPPGTLKAGEACVDAEGNPLFPDLVLGTWTCRGWHVGEGAATATGPVVITTQSFDFGKVPGRKMIVTDGFELIDFDVPIKRPIVGGSGPYRNASGQSVQRLFDFSGDPPGVKLHVKFRLEDPA